MLEQKTRTVLLLLVTFCVEPSAVYTVRVHGRSLQRNYRPQNLIQLSRKYVRQQMKTEDEENSSFLFTNRQYLGGIFDQNTANTRNNPDIFPRFRRDSNTGTSAEIIPAEPEPTDVTPETNPEPGPEWSTAFQTWGKAWDLHIYLFAVIYILIAVTSGVGLADDVLTNHRKKGLKLTLYLTFLFLGCSRAIILFVDPYSSQGILEFFSAYITWSLGFPCVLTALGLLLLVFVDATNMMHIAPLRFQKLSAALGVMLLNVIIVLGTDIVFLFTQKVVALIIICHVYFVSLGIILTAGFFRIGFHISSNSAASIYGDTGLQRLRILAFITAVLNLLFIGTQVYSVFDFVLRSDAPSAWSWYALQTSLRVLEVSMCVVMLFIVFNNKVRSPASRLRNLRNRFRNAVSPFRAEAANSGQQPA